MEIDTFEMRVDSKDEYLIVIHFLLSQDYQWEDSEESSRFGSWSNIISLTKIGHRANFSDRPRIIQLRGFSEDEKEISFDEFVARYIHKAEPEKDGGNIFSVNDSLLSPINR